MQLIALLPDEEIYLCPDAGIYKMKRDSYEWLRNCNGLRAWEFLISPSTVASLQIYRQNLLIEAHAVQLFRKDMIIRELSAHVIRDCIPLIDYYLSIYYQFPNTPDLCENVLALVPELNLIAMKAGEIGADGYIRYTGVVYDGINYFADNIIGSDCWWLYDKCGHTKGPCSLLITICLKHRASQL